MRRKWLLWQLAGFTGSDTQNHLITFPEFVAHYLLAWSRVWRPCRRSPTPSDVPAPDAAIEPWLNRPWFCNPGEIEPITGQRAGPQGQWSSAAATTRARPPAAQPQRPPDRPLRRLQPGRRPGPRQHLDGMIFDDHEVADDWNLNGRWWHCVYGREWGRFIVRNGLAAYTLMQPGQRPHFTQDEPGRKLLDIRSRRGTGAGADAGDDRRPRRAARLRPTANRTGQAGPLQLHGQGAGPQRRRTRHAHASRRQQPEPEAPNLVQPRRAASSARAATRTTCSIVVSPVPVFGPAVIEQLGQPLAQLIIDFKHDRHVGEIPGFALGDLDDPQKARWCAATVSMRRRSTTVRAGRPTSPGSRHSLPVSPRTRRVVLLGDVHYVDARSASTGGSASPIKSRRSARRAHRRTSSRRKSRRSPAMEGTSSGPRSARRAAGVERDRRHRPRRRPVCPSRWPDGPGCASDPRSCRRRVARSEARSRQALPDWSWRLLAVVDTTTKAMTCRLGSDRPSSRPTRRRRSAAFPRGRHRPPDAGQRKPMLRRIVFDPNFGTLQFAGARRCARRAPHPHDHHGHQVQRDRGGPAAASRSTTRADRQVRHTVHRACCARRPVRRHPTSSRSMADREQPARLADGRRRRRRGLDPRHVQRSRAEQGDPGRPRPRRGCRPAGPAAVGQQIRMRHPDGSAVDVDKAAFDATVDEVKNAVGLIIEFIRGSAPR